MKLYTEEQVRKAIELARESDSDYFVLDFYNGTTDEIVGELTPIELPSDEEIGTKAKDSWITYEYEEGNLYHTTYNGGFINGAKWVIEKIKKQVIP